MTHSLPENDWRLLRTLQPVALDRYCTRVMQECSETIRGEGTSHERYLRLYKLLMDRDERLGLAFNDMRRSRAVERLASMLVLGVVTDDELRQFSPATRDGAKLLAGL